MELFHSSKSLIFLKVLILLFAMVFCLYLYNKIYISALSIPLHGSSSQGVMAARFDPAVYSRMELPLPEYTPYYRRKKQELGESEQSVCTPNDPLMKNSDPRPTGGCLSTYHSLPGITLFCRIPIYVSCSMTLSQARDAFYRNLRRLTAKCDGIQGIGNGNVDGIWRVCLTPPFHLKKNACLVYSFGINNEWSFDDAISKDFGCQLHAFDPTMAQKDHKRDTRITFHNMGVAGHGERFKEAKVNGWKMMTIGQIIQSLGHNKTVIDILKLDIEYTEWDALEDAVLSGALKKVKQIALEFHVWIDHVKSYVRFHRIVTALENAGFEKWFIGYKGTIYKAINQETGDLADYHYQMDMGWINTNFLK